MGAVGNRVRAELQRGSAAVDSILRARGTGWIARYAWSGKTGDDGTSIPTDYHDELLRRLRKIEAELLAQATCTTRCYVDTGPLVERSMAAQAGVGWIGKNTCVLNQQLGSWLLLGIIVTSLPLDEPCRDTSGGRPLRHLHALHRCLPHGRAAWLQRSGSVRERWMRRAASRT